MDSTAATVTDNPDKRRFELTADGWLAGFAEYRLDADTITFIHTEVDQAFSGRGLGSVLARGALDDARRRGLRVVAECPFIRGWIAKHPDYSDLVSGSAPEPAAGSADSADPDPASGR
jgi:predicted GNAT family acetyltransferase